MMECTCHISPPCEYCIEKVLCTECAEPVHPSKAYEVDEDNYCCEKCYKEERSMETNVIKLKFINQGIAQGRAYTYFSNVEVEVDEVVSIDDKKQGIVTEINVPLTEIEPFKDKAKTILGKYVEETEIEEMEVVENVK